MSFFIARKGENKMVDVSTMMAFLEKFQYEYTEDGVQAIYDEWKRNKGWLVERFRNHPNWDENNLALVFKDEEMNYEVPFNGEALSNFCLWANRRMNQFICKDSIEYVNTERIQRKYGNILDYLSSIAESLNDIDDYVSSDMAKEARLDWNVSIEMMQDEVRRVKNKANDIGQKLSENHTKIFDEEKGVYVYAKKENEEKYGNAIRALDYIRTNVTSNLVTDIQAKHINTYCHVNAVEGMKLSKIIGKICKSVDLHLYKEMRSTINPETGEITERDYGYNREFAIMADAINPHYYKRITVISLNPLDYWGMSLGYKWQSCHTIDVNGVLENEDTSHHYHGAYSSGTESYMLDSSSIIYYVIREDYEGNQYWNEPKMNRCVFAVNKEGNAILQSRVYPDGRDGGDNSLAGQFRKNMQKVIATIFNYADYWKVEKGSSICEEYTDSCGTHYKDYTEYGDGTMSFLVGVDRNDISVIEIGHDPICPNCGNEHDNQENICCEECLEENTIYCDRCGERIRDRDEMITTSNGSVYCCEDCANNDDYYYCDDTNEYEYIDDLTMCSDGYYHLSENCFYDPYLREHVYGEPEVETEDGKMFETEYNAREYGYVQDYFSDDWYKEDDLVYDEFEEVYFDPNNCNAIQTTDGEYFASEDSAEDSGYHKDYHSDEWMPEDDMEYDEEKCVWFDREGCETIYIEDEDIYFIDDETANDNGYYEEYYSEMYVNIYEMENGKRKYYYDEYHEAYFDTTDDMAVKTIDGHIFASEESANDSRYYEDKNGVFKPNELLDIEELSYIDRGNPNSINAIVDLFEERYEVCA